MQVFDQCGSSYAFFTTSSGIDKRSFLLRPIIVVKAPKFYLLFPYYSSWIPQVTYYSQNYTGMHNLSKQHFWYNVCIVENVAGIAE